MALAIVCRNRHSFVCWWLCKLLSTYGTESGNINCSYLWTFAHPQLVRAWHLDHGNILWAVSGQQPNLGRQPEGWGEEKSINNKDKENKSEQRDTKIAGKKNWQRKSKKKNCTRTHRAKICRAIKRPKKLQEEVDGQQDELFMLATQSYGTRPLTLNWKYKSHNIKRLFYYLGPLVQVAFILLENDDCIANSWTVN